MKTLQLMVFELMWLYWITRYKVVAGDQYQCMLLMLDSDSMVFFNDTCISGDTLGSLTVCSTNFSMCLENGTTCPCTTTTSSPMTRSTMGESEGMGSTQEEGTCLIAGTPRDGTACQLHSSHTTTTLTQHTPQPSSTCIPPESTTTINSTAADIVTSITTSIRYTVNSSTGMGSDNGDGSSFSGHIVYYSFTGLALGVSLAFNIICTCTTVRLSRNRRKVPPRPSIRGSSVRPSVRYAVHEQQHEEEEERKTSELRRKTSEVAEYITIIGENGETAEYYYAMKTDDLQYEEVAKQNEAELMMTTTIGEPSPHPLSPTHGGSAMPTDIPLYSQIDKYTPPPALPAPYGSIEDMGVANDSVQTCMYGNISIKDTVDDEAPPTPPPIYSCLTSVENEEKENPYTGTMNQ